MRSITPILRFCFLSLVLTPLAAFGQESAYKAELYGGIGHGKFYDDEGSLGAGPTYRAGVGMRVASRLAVRAEALGIHHTRGDYFHVTGNSLFVFVENNALVLGTWQGIYFCEWDGPRQRKLYVKIVPD